MIAVPERFASDTVAREGEAGAAWLAELPGIVDGLLDRWRCVPDGDVTHGAVGLVVPVRGGRAEGAAVLKVSFPHPGNVHEPDAFDVWGGRGAVRLYARDDARFAMLLERALPLRLADSGEAGVGADEAVTVAGLLSRRLAVPAPPALPRLRDRAREWEAELRAGDAAFPGAVPRRAVDAAVAAVRELGRDQPDTLVHGDLHPGNILRAEREPWLAVDPKGYAGDPAYDGGTLLKSQAAAFLDADDLAGRLHRVVALFAESAGLERERVRRWAQFHAVDTAYWSHRYGGSRMAGFAARVGELLA